MVTKCKNCGVEYWDSLADCPYCGIPNLNHPQFVMSVQKEGAYERVMKHKNRSHEIQR
ncbi:MAG: hypothetical protein ABR986_03410 [Methanomassiliicoccales archaeon]|jgi:uncharacterized OB-fold protein